MPTCAIYARVSDESQVKGDSIEHQIAFCKEVARRRSLEGGEPWLTPDTLVYVDEGITGTSLVKREQVQRLIRDAREHKFDIVLFKGISRFARDTVDALLMLRTLLSCNVRVISMEENFDSHRDNAEFVFTIHSALAQAESEKTAIRVRMGATQKAKQGKWNGKAPDGYVLNPETKRLEIDPEFAPVIREVFALYLDGYGCRRIANILNERGIRTKQGKLWTQRNISRLLRNPAYVGDVAYGRRERKLAVPDEHDPLSLRKKTVWVSDPERVIVCRNAHPAIIDRETFSKVAVLIAKRRNMPGRTGKLHLLTKGLMRCRCGSSMTIKYNGRGTPYYRCVGQADKGRSFCGQRYIRAQDVEEAVLRRVKEDIAEVLRLDQVAVTYHPSQELDMRLREVEHQIEAQLRKSQLLFDQFANGTLSEEQFVRMNQDLRDRIAALRRSQQELHQLRDKLALHVDAQTLIKDAMHNLLSLNTKDAQATRQILEVLIDRVLVTEKGIEIQYRFAKS
ncbi:MAG: recombinase family protein [Alicyclobacillus macrosporangiidus]|uniref:recombinase family protein n=1 Tax=Alicyclobacillus macrosporangiidus TaxID=392015 RepID=UPI0026F343E4|nr:recombinase family protein [Alicyclobacillus macrosporangiidus]MCL6599897.1 recombinase family protein [Alicyclobacillus macrosporangiidus]